MAFERVVNARRAPTRPQEAPVTDTDAPTHRPTRSTSIRPRPRPSARRSRLLLATLTGDDADQIDEVQALLARLPRRGGNF